MKFTGAIVGTVSGSVGGITGSHNKGGQYLRRRSVPTNPNSVEQQRVRSVVAFLSNAWISSLTQSQRDAWGSYAANTPVLDRLGNPMTLTGMNMYLRGNTPRGVATNLGIVTLPDADDGPPVNDLGAFTPVSTGVYSIAGDDFDVTFEDSDEWNNEDDSAMLVYVSRPQNPSINFFKGPYRLLHSITGSALAPNSSPANVAGYALLFGFAPGLGQRLFWRVSVTRADGRLSADQRGFMVVAP